MPERSYVGLIAVAAALALAACQVGGPPGVSPSPLSSATPSPVAGGGASPSPSVLPTEKPVDEVPPTSLPQFSCQAQSGGVQRAPVPPNVLKDVRTGSHASDGFDRFVMEFSSAEWSYEVTPQPTREFTLDPSGMKALLEGTAGLRVVVRDTTNHNDLGQPVEAVLDAMPRYQVIREVRQLGDFEGIVTWGIGISSQRCFRAFVLTNPDRLVVDVTYR